MGRIADICQTSVVDSYGVKFVRNGRGMLCEGER